ncbi:thermonuclease family protein [Streptomyces sp. NBC_00286]|uniref:thermonuclease family protein n=1 Tax=Streptomyces sp. NBC_00286 TaxID=2975701 RepID=UPI002E2E2F5D|nr:thermonuclease family protein [Streptomyces sp. NBC_00286]
MNPSQKLDPNVWQRNTPWLIGALTLLVLILTMGVTGCADRAGQETNPGSAPTDTQTTAPTEAPAKPPEQSTPGKRPDDAPAAAERTSRAEVIVERIIDGDTIEVRGGSEILPQSQTTKVRLLEIDAPEVGACYSSEATARTAELLPVGSTVRIERDVELKDPYDRYLLYVWNDKDEFVNQSLVRTGHAKAVLYPPNDKYWPQISQAGDAAEQDLSGLWLACDTTATTPEEPDTPLPPDTDPGSSLPPGPPPGPDVDCSDLSGPVWVGDSDPHRLDRDGDGIGCDTN